LHATVIDSTELNVFKYNGIVHLTNVSLRPCFCGKKVKWGYKTLKANAQDDQKNTAVFLSPNFLLVLWFGCVSLRERPQSKKFGPKYVTQCLPREFISRGCCVVVCGFNKFNFGKD